MDSFEQCSFSRISFVEMFTNKAFDEEASLVE